MWEKWSTKLTTDFDYYMHDLTHDPSILGPYVIVVYDHDVVAAMLVGRVRLHRVSSVISFINVRTPKVKVLEIVAGGRLGEHSTPIDSVLASKLSEISQSRTFDLVCFHRMPLCSELFRSIKQLPGIRVRVPHVFHYSVLSLAESTTNYPLFLSGKHRREIRRKTRIVEKCFPGKIRVQCFAEPSELERGLQDAASIDRGTWQHYLGNGLVDAMSNRTHLEFCGKQRWLRIYISYINQLPVAFLVGQLHRQTFYCQHAGYRSEFSRFSVGSLLTNWVLNDLAQSGVQEVDLGEGEQEHHRRLGCKATDEGTVHLYSSTLRGIYLNIFFAVDEVAQVTGKKLMNGWLNKASKVCQTLLISHRTQESSSDGTPRSLA